MNATPIYPGFRTSVSSRCSETGRPNQKAISAGPGSEAGAENAPKTASDGPSSHGAVNEWIGWIWRNESSRAGVGNALGMRKINFQVGAANGASLS